MSPVPPTPFPALAQTDDATAWAHQPTVTFPGSANVDESTLIILPVHGCADHGLGLPLDLEEIVGSAVLREATCRLAGSPAIRVLPPLRFGLTPYGPKLGALDPETAHDLIRELATSLKTAGFSKLVFWSTSPWTSELIDAASRDCRVELGLQTFVVEMAGIGLDLHPASETRAQVQVIGARLLGIVPETPPEPDQVPRDIAFRPGNWREAPPLAFDSTLDAEALQRDAVLRLARLLQDIHARAPLGRSDHRTVTENSLAAAPSANAEARAYPSGRRDRYLPGLSAAALQALPNKADALVIIPVGAIEQHGAHLPVGVDAMLAEAACAGLALRQSPATSLWFGPTITYGKSNEHVDYPGTMSISARTLRRVVRTIVGDLHRHGFRQFALLNTHGGNSAVLVYTLREIQTELGVRAGMLKIPSTSDLSEQESTWGFHAGEWETSLMLALAPALVDMDRAICHYPARLDDPGQLRPENAPAIFSWMTRDIAPDGVMGDATAATTEKGARWFAAAMDDLTRQVGALMRW